MSDFNKKVEITLFFCWNTDNFVCGLGTENLRDESWLDHWRFWVIFCLNRPIEVYTCQVFFLEVSMESTESYRQRDKEKIRIQIFEFFQFFKNTPKEVWILSNICFIRFTLSGFHFTRFASLTIFLFFFFLPKISILFRLFVCRLHASPTKNRNTFPFESFSCVGVFECFVIFISNGFYTKRL